MISLLSARPALFAAFFICGALFAVRDSLRTHATEPRWESSLQLKASPRPELQRLVATSAPPSQWLLWFEQMHVAGRLYGLGNDGLHGIQGTGPGWRWETRLADGSRLVLATDGLVLVAISQGRVLEFSVRDLTVGGDPTAARGQSSALFANRAAVEHITAASAADLARKAPDLFPVYYFFDGPTREIISSHLLPRPYGVSQLNR